MNEDPKKHKFKFEGVVIEKLIAESQVKTLFDQLISNKIRVKGNAIKSEVVFEFADRPSIIKDGMPNTKVSFSNSNMPEMGVNANSFIPESRMRDDDSMPNVKSVGFNHPSHPQKLIIKDKQAEQQLQDLKMEHQKYKHQLSNLVDTYKSLKNRVEMEKSKETQSNLNSNIKFKYFNNL